MYKLTIQSADGTTITHEHESLDVLKKEGAAHATFSIDDGRDEMPDPEIEYMLIECDVTGKHWVWIDDSPGYWDDEET